MLVIIVAFISVIAIIYFAHKFKSNRFDELFYSLPSSHSLPILGNILQILNLNEILKNVRKLLDENDGISTIHGLWMKYVFVSDPEIIMTLCTSDQVIKSHDTYKLFEDWFGVTIFSAEGKLWRKYRTLFTPVAHFSSLLHYIPIFNSNAVKFIRKLNSTVGSTIDIYKYLEICTINTFLEMGMKISSESFENENTDYAEHVRTLTKIVATRITSPFRRSWFLFRFTRDYWKHRKAVSFLNDKAESVMEQAIMKATGRISGTDMYGGRARSLLDLFLETKGTDLSDREISNHLQAYLFAAFDTVSTTTSCALYLLSIHEDIQEKAFLDVKSVFGQDKTKQCTLSDLQNMPYLGMVIKETLRLYPTVPFIAKYTLSDIRFRKHVIPKGAEVIISIDALHRSEKYFPNPHVFDPERFAPEKIVNIKPFTYIPFGAGSRNCIGQKAAILEMKTVMSMVLRNYKLLPIEGYQLKLLPHIVQRPGNEGIRLMLQKREE